MKINILFKFIDQSFRLLMEKALNIPSYKESKVKGMNDLIGPKAVQKIIGQTGLPIVSAIILLVIAGSFLFLIQKIGIWTLVVFLWIFIFSVLYYLRKKIHKENIKKIFKVKNEKNLQSQNSKMENDYER